MDQAAEMGEALLRATRTLTKLAKAEDLGSGDVTSALLEPEAEAHFELWLKQPGVLCGRDLAEEIVRVYDPAIQITWEPGAENGRRFEKVPVRLATLCGPNRSVLAAERVLLNILQRLCGVATLTRRYVDAVAGTGSKIYDTRKTLPGWRRLEKYAVRCGGGHNHRMGLFDAVLVKDNHLAGIAPGKLAQAVFEMLSRAAHFEPPPKFIMIEVETLEQMEELFKVAGVDIILLDNFDREDMRRAVRRRDELGLRDKVALEASGGITLETVTEVARTGVDRISVGALTHSAGAIDLSLSRR